MSLQFSFPFCTSGEITHNIHNLFLTPLTPTVIGRVHFFFLKEQLFSVYSLILPPLSSFLSAFILSVAFCFKNVALSEPSMFMELILVFSIRFLFKKKNPNKQGFSPTRDKIHCSLGNSPYVRLSSFVTQAPLILECFLKRWLMALIDSFIAQFYPEPSLCLWPFRAARLLSHHIVQIFLYKQHEQLSLFLFRV